MQETWIEVIVYYTFPQQEGKREVISMREEEFEDLETRSQILMQSLEKAFRKHGLIEIIDYQKVNPLTGIIKTDKEMWARLTQRYALNSKINTFYNLN